MATQVKMWTMEGDSIVLQYYNKLIVYEEETYVSLTVCLEEKLVLDWTLSFGTLTFRVLTF